MVWLVFVSDFYWLPPLVAQTQRLVLLVAKFAECALSAMVTEHRADVPPKLAIKATTYVRVKKKRVHEGVEHHYGTVA